MPLSWPNRWKQLEKMWKLQNTKKMKRKLVFSKSLNYFSGCLKLFGRSFLSVLWTYGRRFSLQNQKLRFCNFHFSFTFSLYFVISTFFEVFSPIWSAERHQISIYIRLTLCASRYTSDTSLVQFWSPSDQKWRCIAGAAHPLWKT